MLGWIRTFSKRIAAPDQSSPPFLGSDRAPSVHEFHHNPNVRVYDPNSLHFVNKVLPTLPSGPGGPQNFNADCPRAVPVMWDRSGDGCETKAFFRGLMRTSGLGHI